MLLPPVLQNADELFDNLDLTSRVRKHLREVSYASLRGAPGRLPAVYVDAEQLAGAVRPSGNYSVQGNAITANLVLVRDGNRLAQFQIQGALNDLEGLASRIIDRIFQAVSEIK